MLLAWVLYPAVALAVALGIGLAVERASGGLLPGAMLLPAGFAGIIGLSQLTTYWSWSAELTIPLVLAVALAGWAIGVRRLRDTAVDRWLVAAAVGVFAVLAAPVVLSGEATFAGYTILGDTSIHMIGADALLRHGRDFASLPPSSYEFSLSNYYGVGYPAGGPTAAGVLTSIVHLDVAWTFQAFLTLLVVCISLSLWTLAAPVVPSRPLRALVAFIGAQPALIVSYALQGSVKEIGTAFAVVTLAALIPAYVAGAQHLRRSIPIAVGAAALLGVVGLAGIVWAGPLLLGALIAAWIAHGFRAVLPGVVAFVVAGAVLSLQTLAEISGYLKVARTVVTTEGDLGNLFGPLHAIQAFGIWLVGDYRLHPVGGGWLLTRLAILISAVAAIAGAVYCIRRRREAWPLLLYVGVSLIAWAFVTHTGTVWADAKALMIVSPAVVLTVMVGAAAAAAWRRVAVVLAAAIAAGVLVTNAIAYHNVSVAPRDRMAELKTVGERIDGQGPTVYTEFEEFGKHFLRRGAPEGASEGLERRYALRNPAAARFGYNSDPDTFSPQYVQYYRTIVTRRGFEGSRPPSDYKLVWSGRFYDIWQRPAGPAPTNVVAHLPEGNLIIPSAMPKCTDVQALAKEAGPGSTLSYVPRPDDVLLDPVSSKNRRPSGWTPDPADPNGTLLTNGPGRLDGPVNVPKAGTYQVWMEGSVGRALKLLVDGREVGKVSYELNNRGVSTLLGTVTLQPGRHVITVQRGGGGLRAGDGGLNRYVSTIALSPVDVGKLPVRQVPASDWRTICGQTVDWVEAIRGSA